MIDINSNNIGTGTYLFDTSTGKITHLNSGGYIPKQHFTGNARQFTIHYTDGSKYTTKVVKDTQVVVSSEEGKSHREVEISYTRPPVTEHHGDFVIAENTGVSMCLTLAAKDIKSIDIKQDGQYTVLTKFK